MCPKCDGLLVEEFVPLMAGFLQRCVQCGFQATKKEIETMTRQGWTEERRVKFRHTANAKRLARGEPPILEPAPDDHLDEMPVALKEDMSVNLKQQIEFLPVRRRAALPVPVLMQPTSAVFEFANNQPCVQDFVEVWRVQYSDMRLVECTLYKDTTMLRIRMMLDEPLPHDASLED